MSINDTITKELNDIITNGLSIGGWTIDLMSCVLLMTFIVVALASFYNFGRLCRDASGFSRMRLDCLYKKLMDTKKWDFTTNWIGPVAALLALTVATQNKGGSSQYVSLSLFFGMIMIIAPLVHNSACRLKDDDTPEKPQYKVSVMIFLITSAFSLWAVLGGVITVLLFLEAPVRVESSGLFVLILLVMMGLAIWYHTGTTYELVHQHIDRQLRLVHSYKLKQEASTRSVETQDPPNNQRVA